MNERNAESCLKPLLVRQSKTTTKIKIMNKSLLLENIPVIFAAAIASGTPCCAKAETCGLGYVSRPGPDVVVKENEPFVRIWLHRGATNVVETMDYFTVD